MKSKKLSFCFLVLLSLCYCKPDEQILLSNREILTGNKWQIEKLFVEQPPGSTPLDFTTASFEPCQLDDLISFREDGIFFNDDNLKQCAPPNTSMFTKQSGGAWNLAGSDTLLLLNGFFNQRFIIKTISLSKMELEQTALNYFQEPEKYRFVFKPVK